MAVIDDYFAQALGLPTVGDMKQNDVAQAAQIKKVEIPSPQQAYSMAAQLQNNNGANTNSEIENDLRYLNPVQLQMKYGSQASDLIAARVQGLNAYSGDVAGGRSTGEAVADSLVSGVAAIPSTFLGIGALGTGLVNNEAGIWTARQAQNFNDFTAGLQSEGLNASRRASSARQELAKRDSNALYKEQEVDNGKFIATIRQIGRGVFDGGSDILSDPQLTTDAIASGVGSLFTVGPIARGIEALGLGSKTAVPAAVGLMEGGGAYQQTAVDAYNRLQDRDDLTEDQKVSMANNAALMAAAVQGPVAGLTTRAFNLGEFERAPVRLNSIRQATNTGLKEFAEEGIQSGTGQLAQNLGIQQNVDPNQNLAEGVGEQAAIGAIAGLGSAGVTQAPGVALRTTIDAVKIPVRAASRAASYGAQGLKAGASAIGSMPVWDRIIKRGEGLMEEAERTSPVNDQTMQEVHATAMAEAPQASQMARESLDEIDATPEQKAEATAYADSLFNVGEFNASIVIDGNTSEPVRTALEGSTDRFDAMQKLADIINNSNDNSADQLDAARKFTELLDTYKDLLNRDPGVFAQVPADHPVHGVLANFETVLRDIDNTPKLSRAMRRVDTIINSAQEQGLIRPVTDKSLNTEYGKQNAYNIVSVVELSLSNRIFDKNSKKPDLDKIDPESIDQILLHKNDGRILISDKQEKALRTYAALVRANTEYNNQRESLGLSKAELVSKEIQSDVDNQQKGEQSARTHAENILSTYGSGNLEAASVQLRDFMLFAEHMQNKVIALNEALASGKTNSNNAVKYQVLTNRRTWVPSIKGLYVSPTNEGSIENAQRTALDAEAVVTLANGLATIFPELKVKHLTPVSLDQSLMGPAKEVAERFRNPVETQAEPNTETTPPAETEAQDTEITPDVTAVEEPVVAEVVPEQEVTEAEPKKEEATPPSNPMEALFPDLYGGKNNLFRKAWNVPEEAKSRLVGNESPIQSIEEALSSNRNFASFTGSNLQNILDEELIKAYAKVIRQSKNITKYLDRSLQDLLSRERGQGTFASAFKNGAQINREAMGRALNIVEEQSDGGFKYNRSLIEQVSLAAIQWYIQNPNFKVSKDTDDIEDLTGATSKLDKLVAEFNKGLTLVEAKESLATKIKDYWGLTANKNAPIGYNEGVAQHMAAEVLSAFVQSGFLTVQTIKIDSEYGLKTPKIFDIYIPTPIPEQNPILSEPDLIDELVQTDPVRFNYIGQAPEKVAKTQMRNPMVELTSEQTTAIENEQKQAFNPDVHVFDFYQAIGKEGVLYLFGSLDDITSDMNQEHKKAVEGKNLTVSNAYDNLNRVINQAQKYADNSNMELEQVPIFYDYNFSRVNRMQMLGVDNPQSSKIVREAISPTWTTLDLSSEATPHHRAFRLAIAQMLGLKVHKMTREQLDTKLQKRLTELAPVIDILQDWDTNRPVIRQEDLKALRDALGGNLSPMAVHALLDYARYLNQEDKSSFRTSLYVEADGVTNGPGNAMVLLTPGRFTPEWVKTVAKVGLSFNPNIRTMNDLHTSDPDMGGDTNDLYQTASDIAQKYLGRIPEGYDTLYRFMDMFIPDIIFDEETGDLEIKRGATKNPLTITMYGSSPNGIAGNIKDQMISAIYERMTLAARDPKKPHLAMFGSVSSNEDDAKKKYDQFLKFIGKTNFDPINFKFSDTYEKILQDKILEEFVEPLVQAISDTVGPELLDQEIGSMPLLRKTTQVLSIFMQEYFQNEVNKLLEQKKQDPNYKVGDLFSQNEIDGLYKKVLKRFPVLKAPGQNFVVSKGGTSSVMAQLPYRNNAGTMRTDASVYGPKNAGVGGIPFLNIGMGDGKAMLVLSLDQNMKATLKIFDGLNMPLDKIEEYSIKANQAVYESWKGNPLGIVNTVYQEFLKDISTDYFSKEGLEELKRALVQPQLRKRNFSPETLMKMANDLGPQIRDMSQQVEARHRAMARVPFTIDQMAAVGSPYEHMGSEDISFLGSTPEEIATTLNNLASEELSKIRNETPSDDISEPLLNVGKGLKSGLRVLSITSLNQLSKTNLLPETVNTILKDILGTKPSNLVGWKMLYGDARHISEYGIKIGAELDAFNPSASGWIINNERVLLLKNPSAETLVHELVHAVTYDRVRAYYDGNMPLENRVEYVRAIERLEALQEQFLALNGDILEEGPEIRIAYNNARAAIQSELNRGNKAGALNELMAWGLTNEALVRLLKRTEANPIVRLSKQILEGIKRLFWGRRRSPAVSDDFFSNLRFNSAVLMQMQPTVQESIDQDILFHSHSFGNSDRLDRINQTFNKKIGQYARSTMTDGVTSYPVALTEAIELAGRIRSSLAGHFPMTMQEASTFRTIMTALATQSQIDSTALTQVQDLYTHVMKNMNPESFMSDPDSNDPNDRFDAQEKYKAITGVFGIGRDPEGRSTLLPSFLALAITNEDFREVLRKIEIPKPYLKEWNTTDNILENIGNTMMDNLARTMSGQGTKAKNIQSAIDALTDQMVQIAQDRKTFIEKFSDSTGSINDKANQYIINTLEKFSDAQIERNDKIQRESSSRLKKAGSAYLTYLSSMVTEKNGTKVAEGLMSAVNRTNISRPIYDMINDLVGRTQSNAVIYDMIKYVRSLVSQTRQHYREILPQVIDDQFKVKPTDEQHAHMYSGIAKTDLAGMRSGFSNEEILQMIQNPEMVDRHIDDLERRIKELDSKNWNQIQNKTKQLSNYMNTGIIGKSLIRNATAIARVVANSSDDRLINMIDQLGSLYAFEGIDQSVKDSLSSLAQNEPEGISFILSYLYGQRRGDMANLFGRALMNYYKGYVPNETQSGVSLIVAETRNDAQMRFKSYQNIGRYQGSSANPFQRPMSYYYAPVSGKAPYQQGILQNVRMSAMGVDDATGFTLSHMVVDRIFAKEEVKKINTRIAREQATDEPLMPIYDTDGEIVAYEMSVAPEMLKKLHGDNHLGRMIGAWRGRQIEQIQAEAVNKSLVNNLRKMYEDADSNSKKTEFVNIFDREYLKKNPILADTISLLPRYVRFEMQGGADVPFYVRKDMLNDALGYRSASVGDIWTGVTHWNPKFRQVVQSLLIQAFGTNAYKYVMNAERILQNVVQDAKITIVIKSVIVPASNMIANIYQLIARGVPIANVFKGMPKKITEIEAYVKSYQKQIELEAQLRASEDDPFRTKKLQNQLQSLKDSYKRMSIWPLIEAGEFTSISDVDISQDDVDLTEGKLTQYMEKLVDKLPPSVKTAGKYAIVSRDTALFKGLQKAIHYGDFIAKAVLYDELTIRKKLSREEALARITEEFVNYDRLPGRFRGALEANGLLWFWNFKIRSSKIALSMIRNNPVHAIFSAALPTPDLFGSVGTPIEDNIFSVFLDNRLDYSVGPDQGIRAWSLLPWFNLTN